MKKLFTTVLGQFRIISFAEGVSYILLLGLAMPLKYLAGEPLLVRIFGSIHGGLFILFMIQLGRVAVRVPWRLPRVLIAFIASIVPLGAFFLEKSLKREMAAAEQTTPVEQTA